MYYAVVDSADGMIYVDLLLNPERFTGYSGASAHRLWNSIYKENCFRYNIHVLLRVQCYHCLGIEED